MGPNKVKSVQRKILAVKGQIAAAVKAANSIFIDALKKVKVAIDSIKLYKKDLLGHKTTLSIEVGNRNEKIRKIKNEIKDIELNYTVIDEHVAEFEKTLKKLEEQRDKIEEFIIKI